MRAVASSRSLRGCWLRTAFQHPLHAPNLASPAPASRRHERRGAECASLSGSSADASSSTSSGNGWLLDAPASSPTTASSSTGGGSGTSDDGQYDAIMVLGGGLLPDGGLPEWVLRRLQGSLHLYHQQRQLRQEEQQPPAPQNGGPAAPRQPWAAAAAGACPIVLLGATTPHKPPVLDARGHVLYESTAYAEWLMRQGVPAADLLKETQSCDTVGNAYFSLLQHALPAGWRRIAVVTSEFHMPRTRATFDFVYCLAGRQLADDPGWYSLDYRSVSDAGIFEPEVIRARAAKEAAAVATWHTNTASLAGLADLHAWLYATHLCYSVSRQHEFGLGTGLDPKLAATY